MLVLQVVGLLSTVLVGGALADRYPPHADARVRPRPFRAVGALAAVDASGNLTLRRSLVLAYAHGPGDRLLLRPPSAGIVPLLVDPPPPVGERAVGVARLVEPPHRPVGRRPSSTASTGSTVVFAFNAVSYLASFAFVYATRERSGSRR